MTQNLLTLIIASSIGLLAALWSMKLTTDPLVSSMIGLVLLATAVALLSPRGNSPRSRHG